MELGDNLVIFKKKSFAAFSSSAMYVYVNGQAIRVVTVACAGRKVLESVVIDYFST
jgi:hypothetical protein